jgi:hypothetical protein
MAVRVKLLCYKLAISSFKKQINDAYTNMFLRMKMRNSRKTHKGLHFSYCTRFILCCKVISQQKTEFLLLAIINMLQIIVAAVKIVIIIIGSSSSNRNLLILGE